MAAVGRGQIVTVICLSPTLRRHKLQFLPQGYWWQSGGIWGRSDREDAAQTPHRFSGARLRETRRIASFFPVR
ncbi:MAG: hypothetical protein U5N55_09135 [Cypionkella sp.]|nr:hypothetical protein [Cypionkella sp.]